MIIDAHCHITDEKFADLLPELIPSLKSQNVSRLILGGVDQDEWLRQIQLVDRYPDFVSTVIGLHPWTVRDRGLDSLEAMFQVMEGCAANATAVGEVGVDFMGLSSDQAGRDKQIEWCEMQLDLAHRLQKPVVLHVVKGHDVMHRILKTYLGKPGIVHGWTGSSQDGRKYLGRGFVLGIGPRFVRSAGNKNIDWITNNDFVIESDAPDKSGLYDKNDVAAHWLRELSRVAEFLSGVLKVSVEDVWNCNQTNLRRLEFISGFRNKKEPI